ncbi:MAG: tyrosine-type recombinase/integrase [Rhizomicrobium sp.]
MRDPESPGGRARPRPRPRKEWGRKGPIPNTYWRGEPGDEVLYARIEIANKPIRWSLRLRRPLRPGDLDTARLRIEARREGLTAAVRYGDDRKRTDEAVLSWAQHHVVHQVAPSTAQRYASSLASLKSYLADTFIDEIDKAKVRAIVDGRRVEGVTTATIRRDLTALADVLDYAIDQEWRTDDDNPARDRLRKLKERRDPIVLPEHAHIARVIAAASPALAPLIEAALKTGCRQNELVTAQRAGLDHARRQLTVRGKGNKLRVIDLSTPAGDAYAVLRALPVRLGCRWLFWHHNGQPYRAAHKHFHELVVRVLQKAKDEAIAAGHVEPDFRRFRFHDLRHRFAVDYLKAGGSIYTLQQHLGHTSVQTTEIYLKYLTPEEERAAKLGTAEGRVRYGS